MAKKESVYVVDGSSPVMVTLWIHPFHPPDEKVINEPVAVVYVEDKY